MSPKSNGNGNDMGDTTLNEKVEPIVKWLFFAILILLLMLIGMDRADKSDSNIFQVIAGLVSAFSGALLMRIQPRKGPTSPNGGNGSVNASTSLVKPPLASSTPVPPPVPPGASFPPSPTNLVEPPKK